MFSAAFTAGSLEVMPFISRSKNTTEENSLGGVCILSAENAEKRLRLEIIIC